MLAATPEAQPQTDVWTFVRTVLSGVANGVWQAVTTSPIFGVLFALVLVTGLARSLRRAVYSGWERDPVRLFSRTDKAVILLRAGQRCEHHFLLFGRCRTSDGLEADHIHPWSRGGHNTLVNGQALCRRHNREKLARVPFTQQLRALERRRTGHFPHGEPVSVARRVVGDSQIAREAA